jgi:protein-S-isoprenylcysteine O-methyltransferase Ste14
LKPLLVNMQSTMNPWIAKAVILAATIVMIAIRAPHGRRSRAVKTVRSSKGTREVVLLILAWIGFLVPLLWVASPVFSFADYALRLIPFLAGIVFLGVGLWLLYRSHADLGSFWSVTLEVRENHRLISHGVYRRVRHPMYSALFLYSVGQALAVPNWVVGPSYLISFGILFAFRVRREEQMMVDAFGNEYVTYMAKTKRLFPGVW